MEIYRKLPERLMDIVDGLLYNTYVRPLYLDLLRQLTGIAQTADDLGWNSIEELFCPYTSQYMCWTHCGRCNMWTFAQEYNCKCDQETRMDEFLLFKTVICKGIECQIGETVPMSTGHIEGHEHLLTRYPCGNYGASHCSIRNKDLCLVHDIGEEDCECGGYYSDCECNIQGINFWRCLTCSPVFAVCDGCFHVSKKHTHS